MIPILIKLYWSKKEVILIIKQEILVIKKEILVNKLANLEYYSFVSINKNHFFSHSKSD